jgi:hypothetical protein
MVRSRLIDKERDVERGGIVRVQRVAPAKLQRAKRFSRG